MSDICLHFYDEHISEEISDIEVEEILQMRLPI